MPLSNYESYENSREFILSVIRFFLLQKSNKKDTKKPPLQREQIIMGPLVQLGFHWHADTPPILVKLDQEQVTCYIVLDLLVPEQRFF